MTSTTADQASGSPDLDPTLTARQRKIVLFISGWVHEHGYSPSMREIGRAVGLTSTSSVEHQLAALQAKGYLRRAAGCPRTVEVRLPGQPPDPLAPAITWPELGFVAVLAAAGTIFFGIIPQPLFDLVDGVGRGFGLF